jgi:hypothetical protein
MTSAGNLRGAILASADGGGQCITFDSGRSLTAAPQDDGNVRYTDVSPAGVREQYTITSAGEVTEHSRTGVAGSTQTLNHATGESHTKHVTGSATQMQSDNDVTTSATTYGRGGEFGGLTTQTNTRTGAWNAIAKTSAGETMSYGSDQPHGQNVILASGATYMADQHTATLKGAVSDSNRLNINSGAAGFVGLEYTPPACGGTQNQSQRVDYTGGNKTARTYNMPTGGSYGRTAEGKTFFETFTTPATVGSRSGSAFTPLTGPSNPTPVVILGTDSQASRVVQNAHSLDRYNDTDVAEIAEVIADRNRPMMRQDLS